MTFEQARNFCGAIKEFAANLGKDNFLLVGEMAGGDTVADRYLRGRRPQPRRRAGHRRAAAGACATSRRGLPARGDYFDGFDPGTAPPRARTATLGDKHCLDPRRPRSRLRREAALRQPRRVNDHQVVRGVAIQL